jgi:site-specific DNA recombinase
MEATVPSAVSRYEQRIAQLEKEKLLMTETLTATPPQGRFEELFEHALNFLSNPYKLWSLGQLPHKRTVLKLAFSDRLTYSRFSGFRTPQIAQPFRVFDGLHGGNWKVVEDSGFEPLAFSMPLRRATNSS